VSAQRLDFRKYSDLNFIRDRPFVGYKIQKGEKNSMIVKMRSIAIAAAVISGLAASENLVAACATSVTYQAKGSFGAKVIQGADGFKLAGEPFTITLYACEGKAPSQTGKYDSVYTGIALTGTVKSALSTTPFTIKATPVTFILDEPPTGPDLVEMSGNVSVKGSLVYIHGSIALPAGTLTSTAIGPFPSVTIVTAKSAFSYSSPSWQKSTAYSTGQQIVDPAGNAQKVQTAGTSGATAPAWNETLNGLTTDGTVVWTNNGNGSDLPGPYIPTELAVIGTASGIATPAAGANAGVLVHAASVSVITANAADGTESVRSLRAAPVDLLASSDKVMLHFYVSGVRYASEVHVRIAGQEVPVVHSGASADFAELDEVTVELPRSLAGIGRVDMVLTADGQEASAVPIHIQ
jgi:hypothetical protein